MKAGLPPRGAFQARPKVYTFIHRDRFVTFGPHRSETEAADSFQAAYGYWPGDVVSVKAYQS